jgi:hypothetical protein
MKFLKNILNIGHRKESPALNEFINVQNEVQKLPQLSDVENVKFEHDTAISHLYFSSKIEGSHLNEKRLNKAIHAA